MKKNLFFVGALMMASLSMMAQTKNGGINQTTETAERATALLQMTSSS